MVVRQIGRYVLHDELAAGGMATVHVACLLGKAGFARTVAIKRMHPHLAKDPEFCAMFIDEARIASRIRHPNVVATLDVEMFDNELFLVLDYVHGESLSRLIAKQTAPPAVAVRIFVDVLEGLHAAHDACDEHGNPLGIVHRDVSPQNILVGTDGVSRVLDFGVARAVGRLQSTSDGSVKGKIAYMSPEHVRAEPVDRRSDVFAAGIVLWEALTGARLFKGGDSASTVYAILEARPDTEALAAAAPPALVDVVLRSLEKEPADRFQSAHEMAVALAAALPPAPSHEVTAWVKKLASETLQRKAAMVSRIEQEQSALSVDVSLSCPPPAGPTVREAFAPMSPPRLLDEVSATAVGVLALPERSSQQRRTGRTALTTIAGASLLLVLLAIAFFLGGMQTMRRNVMPVASAAATTKPPVQTADPGPDMPPPPPTTRPAEPPEPPASATPSNVVKRTDSGAPSATAKPQAARRNVAPPQPKRESEPAPPSPPSDCDRPFVIDGNGIRRPKLHCLKVDHQ